MNSDMKKRVFLIIFVLNIMTIHASDKNVKKLTFGVEWGYIASLNCGIHHNFFSEEGYRVDIVENNMGFQGNGDFYLHAGYNLNPVWNLSIYAGMTGIYSFHRAIPISVRATRYFNINSKGNRWLAFADGGSGICLTSNIQSIFTGKVGGGYNFVLSPDTSINLLLAYRMTLTHPEIIHDGYEISHSRVNRNNAYVSALSLSLALNF